MFVGAHVGMCMEHMAVHTCVHECGGQRSTLGVVLVGES